MTVLVIPPVILRDPPQMTEEQMRGFSLWLEAAVQVYWLALFALLLGGMIAVVIVDGFRALRRTYRAWMEVRHGATRNDG